MLDEYMLTRVRATFLLLSGCISRKTSEQSRGKQPRGLCINCDEKKAPCGENPHGAKRAPVGGLCVRQRQLTLRSKVVATKIQLDINVERLLLNRGCLTAPAATLTLQRPSGVESKRIPMSTIRVKPRFASGGRTAIG